MKVLLGFKQELQAFQDAVSVSDRVNYDTLDLIPEIFLTVQDKHTAVVRLADFCNEFIDNDYYNISEATMAETNNVIKCVDSIGMLMFTRFKELELYDHNDRLLFNKINILNCEDLLLSKEH